MKTHLSVFAMNFVRKRDAISLALMLVVGLSVLSFIGVASPGDAIIRNSGTIVYGAHPLHIQGRYVRDDLERQVVLRGVNQARFIDTPYGDWLRPDGLIVWANWDANVASANLDAMESWGVNIVRTLATIEWWANNTGNHRQIIKDWIALAAARGIYIDYGFWRVTGAGTAVGQPYPPYCETNNFIKNETDFVELWRGIANELKGYPNVLFELWNEPGGNATTWFDVVQRCITAIRSTGATNLIVVQWETWKSVV